MNITKEAVETAIAKGAVNISGIWKALGGNGNISGSTTKKMRELVPDIQARLDGNKKPTDQPVSPAKPPAAAIPAQTNQTNPKPTKPAVVKPAAKPAAKPKPAAKAGKKFPRHDKNPFRESSAYATGFDIMAYSAKDGIARSDLLSLMAKETGKDEKRASYDLSVLLSAKESPTGSRHKSCREGFWVRREHHHYTLMLT